MAKKSQPRTLTIAIDDAFIRKLDAFVAKLSKDRQFDVSRSAVVRMGVERLMETGL